MAGAQAFLDGRVTLHSGDCLNVLAAMPENSVDSVVTDPPYHLTSIVKRFGGDGAIAAKDKDGTYKRAGAGFMGKQWDGGDIAFQPATWAAVLRVLKPGGYLLAFASTRGFGRMSVAIEDAGFSSHPLAAFLMKHPDAQDFLAMLDQEQFTAFLRLCEHNDLGGMLAWVFGSGFPKATRIKADGYEGFRYGGQALKPAIEPIYMGQKPFSEANGTANILLHGTGALNIDGCRVEGADEDLGRNNNARTDGTSYVVQRQALRIDNSAGKGRWPANIAHDGSDEVLAAFPDRDGGGNINVSGGDERDVYGKALHNVAKPAMGDSGSAARFFYSAKADAEDRLGSKHPTVKPLDLMQYLCRLVTPPSGTILDPFAGTGTTGEAAWREGFRAILIEREAEYQADIARRMDLVLKPAKRAAVAKSKNKLMGAEGTPLFGGEAA